MNPKLCIHVMTILLLFFGRVDSNAQSQTPGPRGFAMALAAGHYQNDGALGIELSSPPISGDRLHLRLKMNRTWSEQYKALSDNWTTFNTYWLGLVYNTRVIDRARVYLDAGSYNLLPNAVLSSKKMHAGYYATLGIELFVIANNKENFCYFFSGGFASVNARADKLEGNPGYGRGTTFTNGFRYYFKQLNPRKVK